MSANQIDHYAEAKKVATPLGNGSHFPREYYISEALLHATLAAVEEQRTANLIAWLTTPYVERTPETIEAANTIRERLGLK